MKRVAVNGDRRQYPTPTPRPARYSSPITPARTGRSHSSRTKNAAPAVGEPIGGAPDPTVNGALLHSHIVVSVGPYTLTITRPGAQRSTNSGGHASAPITNATPSKTLGRQHRCRRRRLSEHGDLLIDQQRMEVIGGAGHRIRHHHQTPAMQQRTPDLPHREIEGIRMELRPHLPRRQLEPDLQAVEQLDDVAVRDRNTLGHTRGSGGVDDVRNVIGARASVAGCQGARRRRDRSRRSRRSRTRRTSTPGRRW